MKKIRLSLSILSLFLSIALCAQEKSDISISYIQPTRIVWMSDNSGNSVKSPENLLKPFSGQISVAHSTVCTLDSHNGAQPGILLDFGKEHHGGIQIVAAIRGEKQPVRVRVRLGESVTEAMSDYGSTMTNDHAMRDFIIQVPWLGSIDVGDSGFRFARIDLIDENVQLPIAAVRTVFKYRDISYLGSFKSSDERLNQIWQTGAYTVHLNMQEYLWDGIKRDRLVWLGDLHPEVMTVSSVFGNNNVVPKSLDFGREDTPLPGWMNGMCAYSLWWIIIHRDWYMYQGDMEYLREQHTYLTGLVDQIIGYVDNGKENLQAGGRFLDWPTSEMPDVIHAGLQALVLLSLDAAGEIADHLNDKDLSKKCKDVVKQMKKYKPEPGSNKQAAALLLLADLITKQKAQQIILKDGANGFSTFYGYYMLEALAKAGEYAQAMEIISNYWGGMLDLGATTFWEDLTYTDVAKAARIDEIVPEGKYDIHADGGAYCYVGLRHSFCHGWASGPTPWLIRHVLGIEPLEPGFKKVRIKPNLGSLQWVEGSIPTPHGLIEVRHEKQHGGLGVKTTVNHPAAIQVIK